MKKDQRSIDPRVGGLDLRDEIIAFFFFLTKPTGNVTIEVMIANPVLPWSEIQKPTTARCSKASKVFSARYP
jgi:hypothetical protein